MSTLSGQENLNHFTQRLNSVTDKFTFADQSESSHSSEHSDYKWILDFLVTPPDTNDIPRDMSMKLSDDDKLLGSGLKPALTVDMNPNWESYLTPMSSLGDECTQHFNSHDNSLIDVRDGAWCFELDPSHLDHSGQASNEPRLIPVGETNNQFDKAGASSKGWNVKKRKARETIILTEEQQAERIKKKREADKKYRADLKMELDMLRRMKLQYDKLMIIASRFGGIVQMVSYINHSIRINSELLRLQQKEELEGMSHTPELMKSKYGGIEKEGSVLLDKLKDLVAESHKLNQIKSNLGIQETESIVEKFKEMESELRSLKQKLENRAEMESFPFPSSPGTRQQKGLYADEAEDFDRFEELKSKFGCIDTMEFILDKYEDMKPKFGDILSMEFMLDKYHEMEAQLNSLTESEEQRQREEPPPLECGINLNSSVAVSATTTTDLEYSDVIVDQLIQSLTDENVLSNLEDLGSFEDLLEGDRQIVGKYKIPKPLVSTAQNIFNVHGDITKKSKYSVYAIQNIFVLFCAAIKEMTDRSLEQVTEQIIWKLRDPIMDAKRSEFDVEFAMKYLTTIVQGYFGLRARKDRNNLEQTIACLRADEEALRIELENKSQQIKATEAKQRELTSEKCRICQESADQILCKTVCIF